MEDQKMNTKNRKKNKTILVTVMVCIALVGAFFAGVLCGEYNTREKVSEEESNKTELVIEYTEDDQNNEMFKQGLLAGVDYMALSMLYESGGISDEDYEKMMGELEKYIMDPSEENMNAWYELYEEILLEGVLP